MKIEITSEAEEYIAQKGNDIFIMAPKIRGCCVGVAPMPKIAVGKPKDGSLYDLKNYNNINIFVDKQIVESSSISISLSKLLWINELYIELTE